MNNPIRYNLNTVVGFVYEDECGKYVLYSDYEELKEGNDCLGQMHDKEMERSAYLLEEFNRTTAWGRGLESDLSHARVEISFLKAEVERLRKAGDELERVLTSRSGSYEAGNASHEWQSAKNYNPSV
jgi:hypothetical protein